jgi:hypothetical protein
MASYRTPAERERPARTLVFRTYPGLLVGALFAGVVFVGILYMDGQRVVLLAAVLSCFAFTMRLRRSTRICVDDRVLRIERRRVFGRAVAQIAVDDIGSLEIHEDAGGSLALFVRTRDGRDHLVLESMAGHDYLQARRVELRAALAAFDCAAVQHAL